MMLTLSLCLLLISALLAYLTQRLWIKAALKAGLVSKDLHKLGEVKAVKVGTVPHVLLAIASLCWATWGLEVPQVIVAASYYALLGLADDLIGLNNLEKIVYSSFPFIAACCVYKPFNLWSGLPYQLALIFPLVFGIYVTNAVNTLAGFNGLEAGSIAVISGFLSAISYLRGYGSVSFIFLTIMVLSAVFLTVNWYPAKAFPGNLGTFFFGGTLALASSLYGLYWETIILTLPHGVDFFLKLVSWGRTAKKVPAKVRPDGKLEPPGNLSLAAVLIRLGVNSEKKLVETVLIMEVILGLIALTYSFLTF